MKAIVKIASLALLVAVAWSGWRLTALREQEARLDDIEATVATGGRAEGLLRAVELPAGDLTVRQEARRREILRRHVAAVAREELRFGVVGADGPPMRLTVARAAPLTTREDRLALELTCDANSPLARLARGWRLGEHDAGGDAPRWTVTIPVTDAAVEVPLSAVTPDGERVDLGPGGRIAVRRDRVSPEVAIVVDGEPATVSRAGEDHEIDVVGAAFIEVVASDADGGPLAELRLTWRGEVFADIGSQGADTLRASFSTDLEIEESDRLSIRCRDAAGNGWERDYVVHRRPRPMPRLQVAHVDDRVEDGTPIFRRGDKVAIAVDLVGKAPLNVVATIDGEAPIPMMNAREGRWETLLALPDRPDGERIPVEVAMDNGERREIVLAIELVRDREAPRVDLESASGDAITIFPQIPVTAGTDLRLRAVDAVSGVSGLQVGEAPEGLTVVEETTERGEERSVLVRIAPDAVGAARLEAVATDAAGNRGEVRRFDLEIAPPLLPDDGTPPSVRLLGPEGRDIPTEEHLVFRAGDVPALTLRIEDPAGFRLEPGSFAVEGFAELSDLPTNGVRRTLTLTRPPSGTGPLSVRATDVHGREAAPSWRVTIVDREAELSGEAVVDGAIHLAKNPARFRVKLANRPPDAFLEVWLRRTDAEAAPREIARFADLNGEITDELAGAEGDWVLEVELLASNGRKTLARLPVRR
ncbi:MAG: hypothetical protein R3F20_06715 [Planctomycetota bacterium]